MTHPHSSEQLNPENKRALSRLRRAIEMSQGQFSLILVCCNYPPLRRQAANQLRNLSSVPIRELTIHPSVNTLFSTILATLEERQPPALMVFGLESVVEIDRVLSATNLVRDEFRKQFSFPVVLWIDDEILQKMVRLAPDFKSWAANPIRLEVPKPLSLERTAITA